MTNWRTRRGIEPYSEASKQPLPILVFLLPLIAAYEVGLLWLLRSEHGVQTIMAHKMLLRVFDVFGLTAVGGLSVPGIALVVILLVWQVLVRRPWTVDGKTIGTMALESMVWVVPLLVLAQVVDRLPLANPASAESVLGSMGVTQKILVSIGAGLYEELVFRMFLIAAIHAILVDIGRATNKVGAIVAIGVSAVCFAYYHFAGGLQFDRPRQQLVFFSLAGLYFGVLYVMRGFGIAVAVHAFYDIVTLLLLQSDT